MKTISAGVIMTDGKHILLGHSTNNSHWDIPKGVVEEGEDPFLTAIRELFEETDLRVMPSQLRELGQFEYTKSKDLILWCHHLNYMPDINTLKCTSTFETKDGRKLPELDKFKNATWGEASAMVTLSMAEVLNKVKLLI